MTIESDLKRIADALEKMALTEDPVYAMPLVTEMAPTQAAPVVEEPSPAPKPAPAPAAPAPQAPFATQQELNKYTMEAYQAMGPQKGSQIQTILGKMGFHKMSDIPPEKYAEFYAAIEALKNG